MAKTIMIEAAKGYASSQIAHILDGLVPGLGTALASMGALGGIIRAVKQGNNQDIICALIENALGC
jgi:hypothetical protein